MVLMVDRWSEIIEELRDAITLLETHWTNAVTKGQATRQRQFSMVISTLERSRDILRMVWAHAYEIKEMRALDVYISNRAESEEKDLLVDVSNMIKDLKSTEGSLEIRWERKVKDDEDKTVPEFYNAIRNLSSVRGNLQDALMKLHEAEFKKLNI